MRHFIFLLFLILSLMALDAPLLIAAPAPTQGQPAACPFDFPPDLHVTCGELTVPENSADPASRVITLPFAIIHSASPNPRPDPIIYTSSGGPGLGAFGAWKHLAYNFNFLATRDIILLEQRGTRWAQPYLSCPDLNMVMFANLTQTLPRAQEIRLEVEAARRCQSALRAAAIDLNHYNTYASVADLEALRLSLGIRQWNFIGSSYAARIGLALARDYPQSLRSMVLDSVYDPAVPFIEQRVPAYASALEKLFTACATNEKCAQAYPKLEAHFYEVLAQADQAPLVVAIKHPRTGEAVTLRLTGDDMTLGVFNAMRNATLLPYLPLLIEQVYAGNHAIIRPVAQTGFAGLFGTPLGIYYAVECAEEFPFNDLARQQAVAAHYPALHHFLPTAADPAICAAWQATPVDAAFRRPVVSAVSALILSGEYDAVIPPAISEQAALRLPNATYVNVAGLSHAVMDLDACARTMAAIFVETLSVSTVTCTPGQAELEFVTDADVSVSALPYAVTQTFFASYPIFYLSLFGLLNLLALSSLFLVIRRLRQARTRLPSILLGAASLLTCIWLVGFSLMTVTSAPPLLGFGFPSAFSWLRILPWAILTSLLGAVLAQKRTYFSITSEVMMDREENKTMTIGIGINLAIRFVLELCILAAVGYWGFTTRTTGLGQVGWGLGAPLLIAALWGSFGAPKALFPLHGLLLLGFELIIFGAGPLALYAAGQPTLATAFVVIYGLNKILLALWQQ